MSQNRKIKYIYVSGPISKGDRVENLRRGIDAGAQLMDCGFFPFIPHLLHDLLLVSPKDYERIMEYDLAWLRKCDVLIRLEGDSDGADREEKLARELGLLIFYGVDQFFRWLDKVRNTKGVEV